MKLYLEIANSLEANILKGTYLPGNRFPSVRSLAKKMDVSEGTIQNSLRYLKNKKLVTVKRTQGFFVCDDMVYIQEVRQKEASRLAQNLYSSLHNLGITDTEIIGLIHKELDC